MKKVVIVGAGFSGMSLAYFLIQKGIAVTILEKNSHAGGMISTKKTAYGLIETAANGFLNTAPIERFLRDIGASYVGSSQEAKKRFIYRGQPRRWPFSVKETMSLITKFLFFIPKKKFKKMAAPHESVIDWADQNFTSAFADYLLGPALQGIYAGDIAKLSASLVINPMMTHKKEKKISPSSLLSGNQGMGQLMQQLQEFLQKKGVVFKFNTTWSSAESFDHIVIATAVDDAQKILEQIDAENAQENAETLHKIEKSPLVTATCFFAERPKNYMGFGILFPRSEKVRSLGVLMNNVIFLRGNPLNHSETWILGGALDVEIMKLSDEQIKSVILEDRSQVFSAPQEIIDIQITRWPFALPHYTIDHEKYISQLKRMKGISLHGNYLGSIGLSRILERSEQLAEKIISEVS